MAKILIIDDDQDTITYLTEITSCSGHEIRQALSAKEALSLLQEEPDFSLIFLDIRMPEFDGNDFLVLFNTMFPDRNTAIIVISADTNEETYKQAIENGAKDYLVKPIKNKVKLLRLIDLYCPEDL